MRALLFAIALAAGSLPGTALAGAWTLDQGHFLFMSGVTASRASRSFDDAGNASEKVVFRKLFVQNWMEYGLTDAVTLFAAPEYVIADSGNEDFGVARSHTVSVEAGARILLLTRIGMFSVQGSAKTAGAFDMSVSAGKAYGRQYELRLLYGRSFRVFGANGFFDVQAAKRWIKRPRPDEAVVDVTLGVNLRPKTLLMIQNFNMMSSGEILPPYRPYRLHKLELSVVERLSRRWSLQFGAFLSPAGRNIVQEQGLVTAIWYRL
jgi:hypothetical protein